MKYQSQIYCMIASGKVEMTTLFMGSIMKGVVDSNKKDFSNAEKPFLLWLDNLLKLVKKFLEVEATYLGYIIESDRVRDSVDEMIPFLIKDPQSKPSENLQQIIGALTNTDLQFVKRDGRIFVSKQVRLSSGWEV